MAWHIATLHIWLLYFTTMDCLLRFFFFVKSNLFFFHHFMQNPFLYVHFLSVHTFSSNITCRVLHNIILHVISHKKMYWGQETAIMTENMTGKYQPTKQGVRQDCVLLRDLFSLQRENIKKGKKQKPKWEFELQAVKWAIYDMQMTQYQWSKLKKSLQKWLGIVVKEREKKWLALNSNKRTQWSRHERRTHLNGMLKYKEHLWNKWIYLIIWAHQ